MRRELMGQQIISINAVFHVGCSAANSFSSTFSSQHCPSAAPPWNSCLHGISDNSSWKATIFDGSSSNGATGRRCLEKADVNAACSSRPADCYIRASLFIETSQPEGCLWEYMREILRMTDSRDSSVGCRSCHVY